MSRQILLAHTPFGYRHMIEELNAIANDSLPAGHTLMITVDVDDGPTAKMRGKFHAMLADINRKFPTWHGTKMGADRWKAVFIGAAINQEWIPGLDGRAVPYRKSSENFSRKKYGEMITIAQVFGDENAVEWSDESVEKAA